VALSDNLTAAASEEKLWVFIDFLNMMFALTISLLYTKSKPLSSYAPEGE